MALVLGAASLGTALVAVWGGPTLPCLVVGTALWLALVWRAPRLGAAYVLVLALALRAILGLSPYISDDVYRYLWEGRVLLAGFNPFELAPSAPELAHLRDANHALINHPEYRSIYPPAAQGLFVLMALLEWGQQGLRNTLLAIDFGVVLLLVAWLRAAGRAPGWAIVYAASPVVLLSASSGHVDPLALLGIAGAGAALARGKRLAAGALLGLAVTAKVFPLLLLPWFVRGGMGRVWFGFGAVCAAGALFLPPLALVAPLDAFARDFAFNGALFRAARELPMDPHLVVGAALVLWVAAARLLAPDFARGALLALLGLLLLSPTVHFWYLSWLLVPAAVLAPSAITWPVFAWCVSALLLYPTYAASQRGEPFVEHVHWTWVGAAAPLLALGILLFRRLTSGPLPLAPRFDAAMTESFAVVIPARREVESLRTLLPAWIAAGAARVVVADTPSGDGTRELVESYPGAVYLAVERRGYGAAVLAGLDAVRDLPIAVVADADHGPGPAQVRALLAPFADARVALVCGARGADSPLSLPQRAGNALLVILIALRFGTRFRDLGPFRALRLAHWPVGSLEDRGFGINVEMNVRALQRGLGVREVLLPSAVREHGRNTISSTWRGVVGAARGMLGRFVRLSEGEAVR